MPYWSRLLPFANRFEDGDPDLAAKLRAELPRILNWAVEGAHEWHRDGLGDTPPSMRDAGPDYMDAEDRLAEFAQDNLTFGFDAYVPVSELKAALKDADIKVSKTELAEWFAATGVTVVGGAIVASGVVLGAMATAPPTPSSIARPVYDQSGYLYDDYVYFDPPYENEGNLGLAAVSAGLVVGGSVVVLVGFSIYAGCFLAGG